jgi:drug/metabolite transporter (DMT)-like permease
MILLVAVSVIWAFSFGLVKRLTGLDATAIAAVRLSISLAVFLPFLRSSRIPAGARLRMFGIGTIQFGVMYLLYLRSYAFLHAYEVALFTITTPIFVTVLDALVQRRWRMRYVAAALLSVAGAGAVVYNSVGASGVLAGFALVQVSNICFAAGQVAWRRERSRLPGGVSDASVFAIPYAGAAALTVLVSLFTTQWGAFSPTGIQWATIAYLGAVASGVCFFLWNVGATRVNAGALAAVNNAKVPLGIAVSLLFFGEKADLPRLLVGGALMACGVWVAGSKPERASSAAAG